MDAGPGRRRPARADRGVRRAGRAQHQGAPRGLRGRRPAGPGDPGRRGDQHHRHRHGRQPGRPGRERAGPQRRRGRRADHGPAAGDRPADPRQRRRPARGPLGQEGLRQGRRPARQDDGHPRPRVDRPRRRRAGGGVRHPRAGAGQAGPFVVHRRTRSRSSGSSCATRCPTCSAPPTSSPCTCRPSAETKHLVDDEFLAPPEGRRDPAQHLARRRRRRGGPAQGPRRRHGAGRSRRVRRRAGQGDGQLALVAGPAPARGRHPSHRRVHPAGPARDGRRRGRDRRRVRRRRGPQLRQPRSRPARLGRPSPCATSTGSACSPGSSTC